MNTQKSKVEIPQVKAAQLDEIISDSNFKIIDVRDVKGIDTQGSIPGAINIPLDMVKEEIDKRNENPNSVFNHNGPILFCCTGGVMSYMGAITAWENGIKNVYNLEGGHSGWKKFKSELQLV